VSSRLATSGTRFLDSLGRRVVLRGVNAGGHSKQGPNYLPFDFAAGSFQSALDAYVDRAAAWGIDVLRVPFAWAAVEPTQGADDSTYLTRLDALIDAAWKRRIWTVLDFHQDVYAEPLCGDGFPRWTLPSPNMTPKGGCELWFSKYQFDDDVKGAFDRFFDSSSPVATAYRALWNRMVARYKDRGGVIGFEVLNEPGWGSAVQPVFEATTLKDFYGDMAGRIHALAPDALVFFDLPGLDAITVSTSMTAPQGQNLVFAPHYYQLAPMTGSATGNVANVQPGLETWTRLGTQWNLPTFVGEFGASHDLASAKEFLDAHWDAFDTLGIHGTQWEYSVSATTWNGESLGLVRADGTEYTALVDPLVRIYPRAIAGVDEKFSFDPATRIFTLEYTATPGAVTEIVVPSRTIPAAHRRVTVTGGCVSEHPAEALVTIAAASAGKVKVTISPE
jgi:endoglycosylceramidase